MDFCTILKHFLFFSLLVSISLGEFLALKNNDVLRFILVIFCYAGGTLLGSFFTWKSSMHFWLADSTSLLNSLSFFDELSFFLAELLFLLVAEALPLLSYIGATDAIELS